MTKPLILCIDDEKFILDSLESQLQDEFGSEFTIELAENAGEAKEIIEESIANQIEIPVILADYLMPGCSGDQFLIWAHAKTPETCNIMLTGQAGLDAVITAINHAGLYRYIAKPWERNDLILTIREAVASFRRQKMIRLQNAGLQLLNTQLQQVNKDLDERVTIRTQELNQQKILFQQVFDNSPDGMVIIDETGQVLQANKSFGVMFGYDLSEVKGSCLPKLIIASEFQQELVEYSASEMARQTVQQETQRSTKDGKPIPVSLTAYPLQIDESTRGAIVIYQDLTFKRQTVDLLQRAYDRHRRDDFFNGIVASQKKIGNDIYVQGQLLGIHLKNSFLLFFLYLTAWGKNSDLPVQDEATGIQVLIDKVIDWLSEKPQIYAWNSQAGIGVLYTVTTDHRSDISVEKQIAENLLEYLDNDFPKVQFVLGLAEFCPEMERFSERFRQARISALIGAKLHPGHSVHHYLESGAFPLLSKLIDDEESERFLNRTIGKLMEYDKVNGTNLFLTLEKIIAHDNLRLVADEMFLHYKTIIFRKQSIEKILGVSLDSFEGNTLIGTAMALYYFQRMKDTK
jgi:PAS domain S-box-containing protein